LTLRIALDTNRSKVLKSGRIVIFLEYFSIFIHKSLYHGERKKNPIVCIMQGLRGYLKKGKC
jgi:hypothetical protein